MTYRTIDNRGFSLTEAMIVLGILGGVMAAVFTLFQTQRRFVRDQEEVVEVQQNLRVAMDSIVRDIRMSGFLVPSGVNPIGVATANSLTINTASAEGSIARINADITTGGAATIFTLDSPSATFLFDNGDYLRIVRPQDRSQPFVGVFKVTSVSKSASTLTLTIPAGIQYKKGDMIVRTTTSAPHPNTISYSQIVGASGTACTVGQNCIVRNANGVGNEVVAGKISVNGLSFSYIKNEGTETNAVAAADLNSIAAVRVAIQGQTGEPLKRREVVSVASIRNR